MYFDRNPIRSMKVTAILFNRTRQKVKRIHLVLLLLLPTLVSCLSRVSDDFTPIPQPTVAYLWDHPLSTPPFIETLTTVSGNSGFEQDVCIGIVEREIWERDDGGSDVGDRIQNTTVIRVNGQSVNNLVFYGDLILIFEYDSQNQPIGSHGGIKHICFDLSNQENGLYLASIEVKSTIGREFNHMWAIKIE